ncbi:hypothetical protein Hs30E_07650 [Lactococcus hodotermopsidis]|uniref:Uncharacterized protein n=1 Tax=Pseudolactococcus hodotermopsidis TaxID=2709157 RepID=A0A6A0BCQ6_9LACT|nr:hypothetical protein [Lactococcus hodotermopsidis]GFH42214.1 hypothetical protein Hs30E_07650 [Lactococcus hodotermopsidis]
MYEFSKWFFDGLGTAIIGLIVGAIGGGVTGFKVAKRKYKFVQKQVAGNDSEQNQQGKADSVAEIGDNSENIKSSFRQSQKAGNNSKQTQIGE